MSFTFGEYIIATHSWSEDQTALDKGFPELIRCKECRFYFEPTDLHQHHTCGNPDGMVHPWPTAYFSYAKRYSVDEEEE